MLEIIIYDDDDNYYYCYRRPLSVKQCLWFRLFNHPDICQFTYYNKQRQAEFNKLHETLRQDFVCEFPFFWVVKKLIDKQIDHYNGEISSTSNAI